MIIIPNYDQGGIVAGEKVAAGRDILFCICLKVYVSLHWHQEDATSPHDKLHIPSNRTVIQHQRSTLADMRWHQHHHS